MAKGKYEKWLEEKSLILLKGWAREGLTDDDIAKKMGISRTTLYDWIKKFPDISNSLKEGKEVADFEIENALFQAAKDGNTTAMIFWLKNRRPDKWRDKPAEVSQESNDKLNELIEAIRGV